MYKKLSILFSHYNHNKFIKFCINNLKIINKNKFTFKIKTK